MAWKPGKSWPAQAELTYVASLVVIAAAVVSLLRWGREGRGWR